MRALSFYPKSWLNVPFLAREQSVAPPLHTLWSSATSSHSHCQNHCRVLKKPQLRCWFEGREPRVCTIFFRSVQHNLALAMILLPNRLLYRLISLCVPVTDSRSLHNRTLSLSYHITAPPWDTDSFSRICIDEFAHRGSLHWGKCPFELAERV